MSVYSAAQFKQEAISFKVLLIGSAGVGKSSLLLKYVKNMFSYDYSVTTGVQYFSKMVKVNEKNSVKLQIWDTVGQQAFKSIVRSLYKGVSAIILLYSIDRQDSFEQLQMWTKQIRENAHQESLIFLVGTKLDLQEVRKVSKKQGENYSRSIDATMFIEVSSKNGQHVKELFQKLAKTVYKKYQSSAEYRSLVKPMLIHESGVTKSQSFNLKNYPNGKRLSESNRSQRNCC